MIDWPAARGRGAGADSKRLLDGLQKDCLILGVDGHLSRDLGGEISRMCGQLHVDLDL